MGSSNNFGGEGASINRPPLFNGEGYVYWKTRMKVFIEAIDMDIWDAIENGPFIPKKKINDEIVEIPRSSWNDDEKRKVSFDLKAKNIIFSALSHDEFYRVSQCKSAKEMWDTLQVTHEGTSEVRDARLNSLTHEYELFHMLPNETLSDLQKRFSHIVNHLISLGKVFRNGETTNKILRCLDRSWQPKVTAIKESRDINSMDLATLFGKLQEHEMELTRLGMHEESDKKKKSIALKASTKATKEVEECSTSGDSDGEPNQEEFGMFVKRFNKFFKGKKGGSSSNFKRTKDSKQREKSTNDGVKCHECGGVGHIRMECATFLKKNDKKTQETKGKRAYIVWDAPEKSNESSSSSSGDENANLCLMAKNNHESSSRANHDMGESDDEVTSSSSCSSSNSISYDDLQEAYNEMLIQFRRLAKINKEKGKKILEFQQEIDELQKSINELKLQNESLELINSSHQSDCANHEEIITPCERCDELEKEVKELKNKLTISHSDRNLNRLLNSQRHNHNKTGLGYVHKKDKKYKVVGTFSKKNSSKRPTCTYCGKVGHINIECHIKKFEMKKGTYMWIKKGESPNTNPKGPNIVWVPKVNK